MDLPGQQIKKQTQKTWLIGRNRAKNLFAPTAQVAGAESGPGGPPQGQQMCLPVVIEILALKNQ